MKIELGYGDGIQTAEIPDRNILKILRANPVSSGEKGGSVVREALKNPIASAPLADIVRPGEKTVIITSDITRPMPTWDVMPAVLDELYAADVSPEDITLVFALGSHRAHTEEEKNTLRENGLTERSHVSTVIHRIVYISARQKRERRWISQGWLRKRTDAYVLAI